MSYAVPNIDGDFDSLAYRYADSSGRDSAVVREVSLWCAVLEQALMDVGVVKPFASKVPRPRKGLDFAKAKHFLLDDKTDFFLVCSLAGVNPAVIREGAARIER